MYICSNSSSQGMNREKKLQLCRLGPSPIKNIPAPAPAMATYAAKKPQHRVPGLRLRSFVIYYMRRAPRPPRLDSVFFFKDEMRSSLSLRKRDILSSKEAKLGLRPPVAVTKAASSSPVSVRTVLTRSSWRSLLRCWLIHCLLDRQANLAVLVDVNYFDRDDIVNLQMVIHVLDIVIGNFRDVNQSRDTSRQINERSKMRNACHLAL